MNANYIDGKLEEADMIRIVRMVLDQVNNEKMNAEREDPSFSYENIEKELSETRKIYERLTQICEAIIPESTDNVVSEMVVDWLGVAYKSKMGALRIRRDFFYPYSEEEIESVIQAGEFLEDPADRMQLILQRDMRNAEEANSDDPLEVTPIAESRHPAYFRSEMLANGLTGAITGGAISLLISFLALSLLH